MSVFVFYFMISVPTALKSVIWFLYVIKVHDMSSWAGVYPFKSRLDGLLYDNLVDILMVVLYVL